MPLRCEHSEKCASFESQYIFHLLRSESKAKLNCFPVRFVSQRLFTRASSFDSICIVFFFFFSESKADRRFIAAPFTRYCFNNYVLSLSSIRHAAPYLDKNSHRRRRPDPFWIYYDSHHPRSSLFFWIVDFVRLQRLCVSHGTSVARTPATVSINRNDVFATHRPRFVRRNVHEYIKIQPEIL